MSLAEAANVGWGTIAGSGAATLVEQLEDRRFRTDVVEALRNDTEGLDDSAARRVLRSDEFAAWLMLGASSPLTDHLSERQAAALGANVDNADEIGLAVGQAVAAVAFRRAGFVDREILRRSAEAGALGALALELLRDLVEVVGPQSTEPTFPVRLNLEWRKLRFRGRSYELRRIDEALGDPTAGGATCAVTGLGGVGKTHLARRFVSDNLERFDLIAWIDATADLAVSIEPLGRPLGVERDTPAATAEAVLSWLGSTERPCLIVLDNVDDRAILSQIPANRCVSVLATSQLQDLDGLATVIDLHVFDRNESVDLLLERVPGDYNGAHQVAGALGDLPLALSHAAAYCAATRTPLAEYASDLRVLPSRELFRERLDEYYELVVTETWQRSIERLPALADNLLSIAAFLDPTDIAIAGFVDFEPGADLRRVREAASELVRWSLASWSTDSSLQVHRLVQKVIRDASPPDIQARAVGYLEAIGEFDPRDPHDWSTAISARTHTAAVLATATEVSAELAERIAACGEFCLSASFHAWMPNSVAFGEQLTAWCDSALGREHPLALASWSDLAAIYWRGGDLERALAVYERIADVRERLLGPDHPDTLTVLGNIGATHRQAGRLETATELYERVAEARERVQGPDHPSTLGALAGVAAAYWQAERTEEAIAIEERVASAQERTLGPEHPDTIEAMANLAVSYQQAERTEEAIAIGEGVAMVREAILGTEHPDTLTSWANLATSYHIDGRTLEAIEILERVAPLREQVLGNRHFKTAKAWEKLAVCYRKIERTDDAIEAMIRAISVLEAMPTERAEAHGLTARRRDLAAWRRS